MSGSSHSRSEPRTPPDMAQLITIVENMRQQNEFLQESVHTLHKSQNTNEDEEEEKLLDPQPLSEVIWSDQVLENFKPPPLSSFDGKSDPRVHIISINNQMAIVGASDSLKCKLMMRMFKDVALCWYMSLPRLSITGYQDLTRKMVQHFSANKHRKVTYHQLVQRPPRILRIPLRIYGAVQWRDYKSLPSKSINVRGNLPK